MSKIEHHFYSMGVGEFADKCGYHLFPTDSSALCLKGPDEHERVEKHDKYDLDMTEVVRLVQKEGVPCEWAHTGGNTGTIYAGTPRQIPLDEPGIREGDMQYPAIAGPGNYGGITSSLYEMSIGVDHDEEGGYTDAMTVGARNEADVAKLIVAQARKDFTLLDFDDIEALGFDGTNQSTPRDAAWEQAKSHVGVAAHNHVNQALHNAGVWTRETALVAGQAAREYAEALWVQTNPKPEEEA